MLNSAVLVGLFYSCGNPYSHVGVSDERPTAPTTQMGSLDERPTAPTTNTTGPSRTTTSIILASAITASIPILLATIIFVLVPAVCKCHPKFTRGGASATGEKQAEREAMNKVVNLTVDEAEGGTLKFEDNTAYNAFTNTQRGGETLELKENEGYSAIVTKQKRETLEIEKNKAYGAFADKQGRDTLEIEENKAYEAFADNQGGETLELKENEAYSAIVDKQGLGTLKIEENKAYGAFADKQEGETLEIDCFVNDLENYRAT